MAPLCVCWLPLSSLIITSIYLCLLNQHFKIVTGKMAIYFLMVIFWLFTDFFFLSLTLWGTSALNWCPSFCGIDCAVRLMFLRVFFLDQHYNVSEIPVVKIML